MREAYCVYCKYWIRIEAGCYYGTCLQRLNEVGSCTPEGGSCKKFKQKDEGVISASEDSPLAL